MPPLHCDLDREAPSTGQIYHVDIEIGTTKDVTNLENENGSSQTTISLGTDDSTTTATTLISPKRSKKNFKWNRRKEKKQDQTKPRNYANMASRRFYKLWAKLTIPVVLVVFGLTLSVPWTLLTAIVPISFAFLQGVARMLNYRIRHADCPLPMAPSHGVVKCVNTSVGASAETVSASDTVDDGKEIPLRLLLIGDSLAVGVGQSSSSTPIMPEAIAKELSKKMGGKSVMWTCHGAPGASTGWIIRELERSIQNGRFQTDETHHVRRRDNMNRSSSSRMQSSSSLSSLSIVDDDHVEEWHSKLSEQNVHFDPTALAPFDIAVVLTGSNDLKNACFPFLAKEEDSDGVTKRAGDYGKELHALLEVLNQRMATQLHTIRESVEAATERVMESVDIVVDRTLGLESALRRSPSATSIATRKHPPKDYSVCGTMSEDEGECSSSKTLTDEEISENSSTTNRQLCFPLVVLPGMPAKSLPAFDRFPLRHLAIPLVDIMDGHKRNLASHHEGEVLFIDAPSTQELADFACQEGRYWKMKLEDNVLLNAHDISDQRMSKIEIEMGDYYGDRQKSYNCDPPKSKKHYSTISVDGIHPNENGYDFWGRYLGNAIITEWEKRS